MNKPNPKTKKSHNRKQQPSKLKKTTIDNFQILFGIYVNINKQLGFYEYITNEKFQYRDCVLSVVIHALLLMVSIVM